MAYRAVDRHNMMERTGFRVEELKFRTFVFQFLALVPTLSISYSLTHLYPLPTSPHMSTPPLTLPLYTPHFAVKV